MAIDAAVCVSNEWGEWKTKADPSVRPTSVHRSIFKSVPLQKKATNISRFLFCDLAYDIDWYCLRLVPNWLRWKNYGHTIFDAQNNRFPNTFVHSRLAYKRSAISCRLNESLAFPLLCDQISRLKLIWCPFSLAFDDIYILLNRDMILLANQSNCFEVRCRIVVHEMTKTNNAREEKKKTTTSKW